MDKNKIDCWYSSRCKSHGPGCTQDVADAKNCGFIAKVEATKKWIEESLLRALRHNKDGKYSQTAKWYLALKKKALLTLTEYEFGEAENSAVEKFLAGKKETNENFQDDYSRRLAVFLATLI